MQSPILLIGDVFLCKNNIVAAKKKYPNYEWVELSAKDYDEDQIRSIATTQDFFENSKAVLITEIPNRKAFRDFILDLIKSSPNNVRFVLWDSNSEIKTDSKGAFNKTWGEWIAEIKKLPDAKVVNNGEEFTEKEESSSVQYVQDSFQKYKKKISAENAKLFISIVGRNRGMVLTEVQKFSLTCPDTITADYIRDNAYPSSKESVLYKFSNALDAGYTESVQMMEQFLDLGLNENLLAEIIAKKARWRLACVHLWTTGMSWNDVESKLVEMGRFPSVIWHSPKVISGEKRKASDGLDSIEAIQEFMIKKLGIPYTCFKKTDKKKASEALPLPFLAAQIVQFVKNKLVFSNAERLGKEGLPSKVLDKALSDYLYVVDGLKEIRYAENPKQDLYEMVKVMTCWRIS